MASPKVAPLLLLLALAILLPHVHDAAGYRINAVQDTYPWTNCNTFESTKKNCPRGEQCLKLKKFKRYAWNWAMKCQSREEYLARVEYIYGL